MELTYHIENLLAFAQFILSNWTHDLRTTVIGYTDYVWCTQYACRKEQDIQSDQ